MTRKIALGGAAFWIAALLGWPAAAAENAVKGREALKKMIGDLRQRAAEPESKSGEKRLVRLNGQWLIQTRDVAPTD